jgi:hypothetical protein
MRAIATRTATAVTIVTLVPTAIGAPLILLAEGIPPDGGGPADDWPSAEVLLSVIYPGAPVQCRRHAPSLVAATNAVTAATEKTNAGAAAR